jgi:hypothetical protein
MENELQKLEAALHMKIRIFMTGGAAMAFYGLKEATSETTSHFDPEMTAPGLRLILLMEWCGILPDPLEKALVHSN